MVPTPSQRIALFRSDRSASNQFIRPRSLLFTQKYFIHAALPINQILGLTLPGFSPQRPIALDCAVTDRLFGRSHDRQISCWTRQPREAYLSPQTATVCQPAYSLPIVLKGATALAEAGVPGPSAFVPALCQHRAWERNRGHRLSPSLRPIQTCNEPISQPLPNRPPPSNSPSSQSIALSRSSAASPPFTSRSATGLTILVQPSSQPSPPQ